MSWFGRMAGRYEAWRSRTERDLVREVLALQRESFMRERGVLAVRDEKAFAEGKEGN